MKFMHLSDLHLGIAFKPKRLSKLPLKSRSLEITERFFEALEIAEEEAIEVLFITGDLFDHPHVSITFVEKVFNKLSNLPMDVFVTIGNHDTFLHNKAYQSIRKTKNIHYFDDTTHYISLKNIDVYGFSTKSFNEETLLTLSKNLNQNKTNVLCLHGDIKNPKDDHYLTSLNTLKSLPFDYIALGHIHKHSFLTKTIAYAGNVEPFDFSETGDKGYITGTLSPFNATFKPINKRAFNIITLTIDDTTDAITLKDTLYKKLTEKATQNDFLRLILKGTHANDLTINEDLIHYLSEDLYYLELIDETTPKLNLEALKTEYKDTIIETLILNYEKHPEDELSLHKALNALLESEVSQSWW